MKEGKAEWSAHCPYQEKPISRKVDVQGGGGREGCRKRSSGSTK